MSSSLSFPPRTRRIAGLKLALPLLAAAVLAGCSGQAEEQAAGGWGPTPVGVVTVAAQNLPVSQEYVGQTAGSREVEIRARVGGILEQRLYEEGSVVAAGTPLFRIDPKPFEAQLAAAEADVASAEARHAQAEREYQRLKPLAEAKATSGKEFDDAQSELANAAAAVKAAKARATDARLNLGYTKVVAPIGGLAGQEGLHEGALVEAGKDLLTTVVQTDPLYVHFSVPENEVIARQRDIADGRLQWPTHDQTEVRVKLADGRVIERVGRLNFADSKIDPATGTLAMRAALPNGDGLLKAGQFVRVVVSGAVRPNAITVPQKALMESPHGKFVYVFGKGEGGATVATIRPVQVGDWIKRDNGEQEWIVTGGLEVGDQVIVDNLMKIRPGAPVQIAQAAPAAPATAPAN